jgi:putative membrane protein
MHWYDGTGMGWLGYLFMGLVMTVLWAGVAATMITLVRRPAHGARSDSAERILAERLAKGDIDSDEYDRVRRVLRAR